MLATYRAYLIVFAAGALAGIGGGYALYHGRAILETPAPAVRQRDSSLVLQRVPDATAKPAAQLPKGATLERVVHVEVQPRAGVTPVRADSTVLAPGRAGGSVSPPPPVAPPCPAVGIDLALVRLRDGTQRVVASSTSGVVLDSVSVDHPVQDVAAVKVLRWAVGPVYGSAGRAGLMLDRDAGPFRIEVGGLHGIKGAAMDAFVGFAVRF